MVYTRPEVIEQYAELQKMRNAANLPLTNITCVPPSEADNTNTVRRRSIRSSTGYCSYSATSRRPRARAALPDRRPR